MGNAPANSPNDRSEYPVLKMRRTDVGLPQRQNDPQAALEMMWQLTCDAWALRGEDVREFRLPRHVVRVIRGGRF